MSRVHMFSDEAGDFTFRRGEGASLYFIIATVTLSDCSVGDELQKLQRELAWQGVVLEQFHAVNDKPRVRKLVYELIAQSGLRIDATALYKPKAEPKVRADPAYFYKLASYLHFKYVIPRVATRADDLMVVASALQLKKKRTALSNAVHDVVTQVASTHRFVTAFLQTSTDPCLQLADYAAWAVMRHLERGDDTWLDMIRPNVHSIFEPFAVSSTEYY